MSNIFSLINFTEEEDRLKELYTQLIRRNSSETTLDDSSGLQSGKHLLVDGTVLSVCSAATEPNKLENLQSKQSHDGSSKTQKLNNRNGETDVSVITCWVLFLHEEPFML